MATLTVQSLQTTGLAFTFAAASSGLADEFSNDGETFLLVKNTGAATRSLVIASKFAPVPKGLVAADSCIQLAATQEKMVGPFVRAIWNDSSGYVQLSYATHTALSLAVVSLNT